LVKSRKKPSAAQLRARAKFSKIMKSGGFNKRRKSAKKRVVRGKRTTAGQLVVRPKKRRSKSELKERGKRMARSRLGLGSASDINKSLLLDDISKMGISRKNKMSIVNIISKRLGI